MLNTAKLNAMVGLTTHQLIEIAAATRITLAEYAHHNIEVPVWLKVKSKDCDEGLKMRRDDALKLRAIEVQTQLDKLKTPEEQKAALSAELAQIAEQLKS